jgi:bacterioferritin-associated ferredoxin
MLVCRCSGVSDRVVRRLAGEGASTVRQVAGACGAGAGCGECRRSIRDLIAAEPSAEIPVAERNDSRPAQADWNSPNPTPPPAS